MNKANKKMFLYIGIFFLILLAFTLIRNNKRNSTDTAAQNTSITLIQNVKTTASETIKTSVTEKAPPEEEKTSFNYTEESSVNIDTVYVFRNKNLLDQHYKKHGVDMGFSSAEEYEKAAGEVVNNPNSLHKTEAEDGDDIYYLEETNEFVVVSTDGYIRTYFNPDKGIDYFNKQ